MTRYSASRGMLYTAPPGPTTDDEAESSETADEATESDEAAAGGEPTPADD